MSLEAHAERFSFEVASNGDDDLSVQWTIFQSTGLVADFLGGNEHVIELFKNLATEIFTSPNAGALVEFISKVGLESDRAQVMSSVFEQSVSFVNLEDGEKHENTEIWRLISRIFVNLMRSPGTHSHLMVAHGCDLKFLHNWPTVGAGTAGVDAKMLNQAELMKLKMSTLRRQAISSGLSKNLEAVYDADQPKEALVDLLLGLRGQAKTANLKLVAPYYSQISSENGASGSLVEHLMGNDEGANRVCEMFESQDPNT
eukprot:SAG22_NODE_276_length_13167_cov_8.415825_15_plen_257_part_00